MKYEELGEYNQAQEKEELQQDSPVKEELQQSNQSEWNFPLLSQHRHFSTASDTDPAPTPDSYNDPGIYFSKYTDNL